MTKKKSHYDGYDYPKYWSGRDYEHECEVFAINELIESIGKQPQNIIDIGCGFGRLLPSYYSKNSKVTLLDPSQDLLDIASKEYKNKKNIVYKCGDLDKLKKLKPKSYDLALMVRVLHHVEDLTPAFENVYRIIKPGGYFILEYANKMHGKDQLRNILQGNFTFPLDIFPVDKRSEKNKKEQSIPFLNFHPDDVEERLLDVGFDIKERRSVSNFRSSFFKRIVGEENLIRVEKYIQKPLAVIHFGPSMFLLAKKV